MTDETIDKIVKELQRVGVILESIRQTGKVSDIERDIVLAKLRTMYEFIQFFEPDIVNKRPNSQTVEEKVPVNESKPVAETIKAEDKRDVGPLVDELIELLPEPEQQPKPELKPEPPKATIVEPVPVKIEASAPLNIEAPSAHMPLVVEKKPAERAKPEILAEKFEKKSFLNETLSQYRNHNDFSKKFQHTPLKDIFSAMSLNDRFLFIKQLFNNDSALFQNTIEKLNSAGSFNDAVKYLDGNFEWDFNESQVQKLLDLVHRRYLSHE